MNTVKIWFLQRFIIILYAFVAAALLTAPIFAAAYIQSLAVTPASVAPGSSITITFQMRTDGATGYFAIAYSDNGLLARCENDWLVSNGIYNRVGGSQTYNYGGSSYSATGLSYAGNGPHSSGVVGPSTTTWQDVTVVTYVPPEKAGNFTIFVLVKDGGISHNCGDVQNNFTSLNTPITVSGATTPFKLDLTSKGSDNADRLKLNYQITNWSESSVRGNKLTVRYFMNQATQSANYSLNSGNWQYHEPDGSSNGINYTHSGQFNNTASSDCVDTGSYTRMTNFYLSIYYSALSMALYPNGGYMGMNQDTDIVNLPNHPDSTDDYSRAMDNAALAENKYLTLYYNPTDVTNRSYDTLLCEWTSPTTTDSLTGEEPCGVNGCNLRVAKSTSTTMATIGDTITFCITVTSTAIADIETYVWDTVPDHTAYLDCDNGCSYDSTNKVVSWFLALAPGYSATRCFRVTVASYPFIIRQGEFFAGYDFRKIESGIGRYSILAIDGWKFWMTVLSGSAGKTLKGEKN